MSPHETAAPPASAASPAGAVGPTSPAGAVGPACLTPPARPEHQSRRWLTVVGLLLGGVALAVGVFGGLWTFREPIMSTLAAAQGERIDPSEPGFVQPDLAVRVSLPS